MNPVMCVAAEETRQDASSTTENCFALGKADLKGSRVCPPQAGGLRVDEASRLVIRPA